MMVDCIRKGIQHGQAWQSRLAVCGRVALLAPVILVASTLNSVVLALGLGDIDVRSSLNQPLQADIDLLAVKSDEINRINVRLADEVAYLTSGVDRAPLLNQLLFLVEQNSAGKVSIKVSTREPIKEPFLDFIIEVNWPSGRLLREYTVLLDPPTFAGEAEAAVAAPTASTSRLAPKSILPPKSQGTSRSSALSGAADPERATEADSNNFESDNLAAMSSRNAPSGNGEQEYGPVAPNESLRSIAVKVGVMSEGLSPEQVMMALFEANPAAFFDNNINNLKAGHVLRIPDESKIAEISKTEAGRMARDHYAKWIENRRTKAATSTEKVGSKTGLAAMSDGAAPATVQGDSSAQLRLLSPDAKDAIGLGGEAGDKAGGKGVDELANLESSELRGQVTALKEQLATMERLITLKDDALVELQRKLSSDANESAIESPPTTPDSVAIDPAADQSISSETTETEAAATSDETAMSPPKASMPDKPEQVEPNTSSDWQALLLEPRMLAIIIGVLLLVSAVVWTLMRRRRAELEEQYDMPMPDELTPPIRIPSSKELQERSKRTEPASSYASPMAPLQADEPMNFEAGNGGLETLETNESEIDPIAEADVYLAYRRFQQAEGLIRDALSQQPDRPDLQLKLLEIYFGSGNKAAFEAQAESLYAQVGGGDPEIWPKVQEMGQELCPDHPLFGGGVATGASLDEMANQFQAQTEQSSALFESNPFLEPGPEEVEPLWQQPETKSFERRAGRSQMDEDKGIQQRKNNIADNNYSLDVPGDEEKYVRENHMEAPGVRANVSTAAEDQGMDFDLSGFNFEKPASMGTSLRAEADSRAQAARNRSEMELDSALQAMSSGSSTEVEEVFTGLDDVDLGGDSGDLFSGADMIGTKLDLARAYIDMDDRDGARGILKEVLEEGSDTQRMEASDLMRKIGS